jgi:segregation and condensation protein B
MELHLIRIVGRSELPGRPFLYGTTPTFLEHFGLSNLKELNELEPTLQRSKKSERVAAHTKAVKQEDSAESDPSLFDKKEESPFPEKTADTDHTTTAQSSTQSNSNQHDTDASLSAE